MQYDDISDGRNKKSCFILCSIVCFVVAQNTVFTVIHFHHLSDCDLYTPPTMGREGETEAGGERPARTQQGARS